MRLTVGGPGGTPIPTDDASGVVARGGKAAGSETMLTRRQFLKSARSLASVSQVPVERSGESWSRVRAARRAHVFGSSSKPLRMPGLDFRLVAPAAAPPAWVSAGGDALHDRHRQFTDQLHPDLPNPTRLWGFGQGGHFKHLSGIVATKRVIPSRSRSTTICRRATSFRSTPRSWVSPATRTTGPTSTFTAGACLDERWRTPRVVGPGRPRGPTS